MAIIFTSFPTPPHFLGIPQESQHFIDSLKMYQGKDGFHKEIFTAECKWIAL